MKIKFMTLAMSVAMLGITSCSKTDVYDEKQQEANKAAEEQVKQEKVVDEYEKNSAQAMSTSVFLQALEQQPEVTLRIGT